jgi:hypothetical protein
VNKINQVIVIAGLLTVMPAGVAKLLAADNKTVPETPLTAAGNTLAEKYGALLKAAQTEIETALPKIDEKRKAA